MQGAEGAKETQKKYSQTKNTTKCRSFWIVSVSFEHFRMAVESWEPSFYIPQMLLFCCNKTHQQQQQQQQNQLPNSGNIESVSQPANQTTSLPASQLTYQPTKQPFSHHRSVHSLVESAAGVRLPRSGEWTSATAVETTTAGS